MPPHHIPNPQDRADLVADSREMGLPNVSIVVYRNPATDEYAVVIVDLEGPPLMRNAARTRSIASTDESIVTISAVAEWTSRAKADALHQRTKAEWLSES